MGYVRVCSIQQTRVTSGVVVRLGWYLKGFLHLKGSLLCLSRRVFDEEGNRVLSSWLPTLGSSRAGKECLMGYPKYFLRQITSSLFQQESLSPLPSQSLPIFSPSISTSPSLTTCPSLCLEINMENMSSGNLPCFSWWEFREDAWVSRLLPVWPLIVLTCFYWLIGTGDDTLVSLVSLRLRSTVVKLDTLSPPFLVSSLITSPCLPLQGFFYF